MPFVARLSLLTLLAWCCAQPVAARDAYWREKVSLFGTTGATATVVMAGDSLTDGAEWSELFPDVHIANRGIDGDTAAGLLERVGGLLAPHPDRVFVMIGINDFIVDGRTVDAVLRDYTKIIATLRSGGARIFVQSTLLCNERIAARRGCHTVNAKVRQLNRRLAAAGGDFTFVDLNAVLSGKLGLRSEFTLDGLHLNGPGYLVWRDAIAAHVREGAHR